MASEEKKECSAGCIECIHPALSSAIATVNALKGAKSEMVRTHRLAVSTAILEADTDTESEEESSPSGIDLSQEFGTITDEDEEEQELQRHSKRKRRGRNGYARIEDESQSRHQRSGNIYAMQSMYARIGAGADEDGDTQESDNVSELSAASETFSQMI